MNARFVAAGVEIAVAACVAGCFVSASLLASDFHEVEPLVGKGELEVLAGAVNPLAHLSSNVSQFVGSLIAIAVGVSLDPD